MHELHVPLHLSLNEADTKGEPSKERAFVRNWFVAIVNDMHRALRGPLIVRGSFATSFDIYV
jgi:hypothetical protein